MLPKSILFASLLAGAAAAEEYVYGLVVFSRHGDRTWKGLPPIAVTPGTVLTTIGQQQLYRSGSYYRDMYIKDGSKKQIHGINSLAYDSKSVYAEAPDQVLLATTGAVFLQALYPPSSTEAVSTLSSWANGTQVEGPMGGYQYSILHTIPVTDASAIWLKGDDECPNRDATLADGIVSTSSELRSLQSKTLSFYQSFADIFEGVLPKSELSFKNAYAIFDYINVGSVHNSTISKRITSDELFQLRTLADASESAINGKQEGSATPASDIKALSGRTLAKKILAQLDSTVAAKGSKNKFNLLVGSYDSFLSFFNLAFLAKASTNFTGLPNYAGSMAFELFTNVSPSSNKGYPAEDDLNVRFLFRNGSEVDTTTNEYPLFGRAADNAVMSYTDFKKLMGEIAIPDVESWCDVCDSEQSFCKALKVADKAESSSKSKDQTMSNAVAGVIGAFVTLGAILLLTAASFLLFGLTFGRKHTSAAAVNFAPKQIESEKSSVV